MKKQNGRVNNMFLLPYFALSTFAFTECIMKNDLAFTDNFMNETSGKTEFAELS